jgi:hypothetical protein
MENGRVVKLSSGGRRQTAGSVEKGEQETAETRDRKKMKEKQEMWSQDLGGGVREIQAEAKARAGGGLGGVAGGCGGLWLFVQCTVAW